METRRINEKKTNAIDDLQTQQFYTKFHIAHSSVQQHQFRILKMPPKRKGRPRLSEKQKVDSLITKRIGDAERHRYIRGTQPQATSVIDETNDG